MKKHPVTGQWVMDDETIIVGSTCPECGMILPTHRAVCSFTLLGDKVLKMNDIFSWRGREYVYCGLDGYKTCIGQDLKTRENVSNIPLSEVE